LLIVGITLLHSIAALAAFLFAGLVLLGVARVSVRRLFPVLFGPPLLTVAIILPAALNVVTPGPLVARLWGEVGFSSTGLLFAAKFVLRATDCVLMAALLTAATRSTELLDALRRLGMPVAFGMVLVMMHRYLVLLMESAVELHEAQMSRPQALAGTLSGWRRTTAGIGILFRRTWRLGQDVYQAMVSRGYEGQTYSLGGRRLRLADYAYIAACAGAVVAAHLTGG